MRYCFLFTVQFLLTISLSAQQQPLTYYLPDVSYDPAIPTPESVLGYQIGEWHISHDQQLKYMEALAKASPRVTLQEYGRTFENRPLIYLTITSESNHQNLDDLKEKHLAVSDPRRSKDIDATKAPVVLYQGFSIHGNEPSGGNAAPLVAYYLAAAQNEEVADMLDAMIILLDPCFNPDGFNRFSTWVNMHKNKNLTSDPNDREYNEVWPGGRTNHYWFDLNRDWLPLQLPESQGRLAVFHEWKPNILTDHHEMGTNATFFFMPGVPQRTNPTTPWKNQELTGEIATYHAKALDEIGSLYYSQEGFDDFYYGKGSTYPDANGCIGILFEQASSRGHFQESIHGELSFPFTIRNQVTTALSTQQAGYGLRNDLMEYQKGFYQSGLEEARKDNRKAFVFGAPEDPGRVRAFLKILLQHQVEVFELAKNVTQDGRSFRKGEAYIVPLEQTQYRMIRAIFDTTTQFKDSLFYDVSSWTLPLAFNIPYSSLGRGQGASGLKGDLVNSGMLEISTTDFTQSNYAYLMEWTDYYAPTALQQLFSKELLMKVAASPLELDGQKYDRGTILIPVHSQKMEAENLYNLLKKTAAETGVVFHSVGTGFTPSGIDLGSSSFEILEAPKVLLMIGPGVSAYDAGEVWHLLDQRYQIPVSKVDAGNLNRVDLHRYNTIIMPDGWYSSVSSGEKENLREWVSNGGTLIAMEGAINWVKRVGLAKIDYKSSDTSPNKPDKDRRPYAKIGSDRGAKVIGGAIFKAELDLTHPIAYGYTHEQLPVFRRGTTSLTPANNPYATPLVYIDQPLISGYISKDNLQKVSGSAGIIISGYGSGKVICMVDNPIFRAFWYGTNKLFANALFFGPTISGSGVERAPRVKSDKK